LGIQSRRETSKLYCVIDERDDNLSAGNPIDILFETELASWRLSIVETIPRLGQNHTAPSRLKRSDRHPLQILSKAGEPKIHLVQMVSSALSCRLKSPFGSE
jgi:hypothetical protein